MPHELQKAYDPTAIEDRWAAYWVSERLFHADAASMPKATPFTILLPPPNVTGRLHMGHMLNQTEMDILTRWRRMLGELALWVPGTDHAGIATQMMVERQLASEGKTRQQLGREAFVERVWEWKRHYGGAILDQMKRLGASVDWSREYFTMDENLSRAVKEAFVRLHEQGLIYRGAYIVNWCPRCQTAISDLEVVHEEQQGKLWEIRYPVLGGDGKAEPGEFLTVATTRPETMLGDVAVAVNPDDERYKHLHGMKLLLPLVGREIPVVTDSWVSSDFGTGAVKVTPAHDPNDFAIGQRHGLASISVMDETGHINAEGGKYAGLDRYVARKRVLEDLEAQGLLGTVREHTNAIGKCDRCKTVVEPRLSTQWFVKIQPLADKAIEAVEQGHIKFTPAQYAKTYFEWMRNIHDWCISRQLWWGHRIPAWHCGACRQITVARETPAKCAHCGSENITQETDVLDTWFSSGLLPFTVFGWPERTADLDRFYPTQLLVTGFDILFFWVARMIMLGCHFMLDVPMADGSARELKDAVPFREVYIHALVRDADRQKMSKTKGNVIDPIEIVQKYGTDAVRFTLASMASPGTDIAFSEARTEGYRAFANKIWNAARFIFMNVERAREAGIAVDLAAADSDALEARWIRSRLNSVAGEVNSALGDYRFDEAARLVYQFFWGDFCDWYLEIVKLRLEFSDPASKAGAQSALNTLVATFETALRLLSPFMPFITEELWHALHQSCGIETTCKSIALTRFPIGHYDESELAMTEDDVQYAEEDLDDQDLNEIASDNQNWLEEHDLSASKIVSRLKAIIVKVRNLRRKLGLPEKETVPLEIRLFSEGFTKALRDNSDIVTRLARLSEVRIVEEITEHANSETIPAIAEFSVIYRKKIDVAAEKQRLEKTLAKLTSELASKKNKLADEDFLAKAPGNVVLNLQTRFGELELLIDHTLKALYALESSDT